MEEHAHAIVVEIGPDGVRMHAPGGGELSTENMPEAIREILTDLKWKILMDQVQEWITPQIASEVLWAYGDYEGTSEPSLARAALINTVRLACISDEEMLHNLIAVDDFRGYCMAVQVFAEPGDKAHQDDGLHFLRHVAGLDPECEDEEEKVVDPVDNG